MAVRLVLWEALEFFFCCFELNLGCMGEGWGGVGWDGMGTETYVIEDARAVFIFDL